MWLGKVPMLLPKVLTMFLRERAKTL